MGEFQDQPVLELRSVTLGYHAAHPVVEDLTVAIERNRWTALIGPNGSGKSTVIRALAGQLQPSAGQVRLNGIEMRESRPRELARQVFLLPQNPAAPPGFSVAELVEQGRYAHSGMFTRLSASDRAAIDRGLELVGMSSFRSRLLGELSGGERQRAFVALALAQCAPILLLDEPTSYLDIGHQFEILDVLRTLQHSEGLTIVTVLHDIGHAARYADRVTVFNQGKVVADGPPIQALTKQVVGDVLRVTLHITEDDDGQTLFVPTGSVTNLQQLDRS